MLMYLCFVRNSNYLDMPFDNDESHWYFITSIKFWIEINWTNNWKEIESPQKQLLYIF
jgi:hypothetical protein